jgi:hypothetical protein
MMIIKQMLITVFILTGISSCAQNKTDLSSLQLNENAKLLLKGTSVVREGKMFDRADMISYGITNENFTYKAYFPKEIEILSYKGELAGYAFRVFTQADQEIILSYLKEKYKNITTYKSKLQTDYVYKDKTLLIEFGTMGKEQFEKGMNAYLSVKRMDFYTAYEKLIVQYQHH